MIGYVVLQAGEVLKAILAASFGEFDAKKIGNIIPESLHHTVFDQLAQVLFEQTFLLSSQTFPSNKRSNALKHFEARFAVGVSLKKRLSRSTSEVQRDVRNNGEDLTDVSFEHIS